MRMAKTEEIVEVEVSDRDAAAANKALELLAKTPELRLWVDQVETTAGHEFDNMSYDELKQWLIEEGRALGLIESEAPRAPNGTLAKSIEMRPRQMRRVLSGVGLAGTGSNFGCLSHRCRFPRKTVNKRSWMATRGGGRES